MLHVREIVYPGTWLSEDIAGHEDGSRLMFLLEAHLCDACVALGWFQDAVIESRTHAPTEMSENEHRRLLDLESQFEAQIPSDLSLSEAWKARREAEVKARLQLSRERWATGQPPSEFVYRTRFMHARSFLFAADGFDRALSRLSEELHEVSHISDILRDLRTNLPHLRDIRDTAHHPEDRIRGLDRNRQPLPRRPIDTGGIHAPGGGLIILDSLINRNRYGCTLSNGEFAEIEVNEVSLDALARALQATVDALAWSGPPRTWPSV